MKLQSLIDLATANISVILGDKSICTFTPPWVPLGGLWRAGGLD